MSGRGALVKFARFHDSRESLASGDGEHAAEVVQIESGCTHCGHSHVFILCGWHEAGSAKASLPCRAQHACLAARFCM